MNPRSAHTPVIVRIAVLAVLLLGGLAPVSAMAPQSDNDQDGIDDAFEATLIERFAPFVRLHSDDEFRPSSAGWYLERVQMRFHHEGCSDHQVLDRPNITLATITTQAHNTGCNDTGVPQYSDPRTSPSNFFLQIPNDGQEQTVRHGDPDANQWPAYAHARQAAGGLDAYDIQYWFFYPYNGPMSGAGEHEADWEHVTVRVDLTGNTIQEMYFSAHYGEGRWYPADQLIYKGGRPVVYSARNSHASYPKAQTWVRPFPKPDDQTADGGPEWDTLQPFNMSAKVTNLGELEHPLFDHDDNPFTWLRYSGRWGEIGVFFSGPHGPAFQGSWQNDGTTPWISIDNPPATVAAPSTQPITIKTDPLAGSVRDVKLVVIGDKDYPATRDAIDITKWIAQWTVPDQQTSEVSYTLYATATIDGNASKSPEVTVKATKTSGSWTVKFDEPADYGTVPPNSTQTAQVQVIGPGGQDADYVDFFVDGVSKGRMTRKAPGAYEQTWNSGPSGKTHQLLAIAYQGGIEVARMGITVTAVPWQVDFVDPLPGGWVEPSRNLTARVQVIGPGGADADYVEFYVDGASKGRMTKIGNGFHNLGWTSGANGTKHTLKAVAFDKQGVQLTSTEITVTASALPFIYIDGPALVVVGGDPETFTLVADNAQEVWLYFNGTQVCHQFAETCAWTFTPSSGLLGKHTLVGDARYADGNTYEVTRQFEVIQVNWVETVVNQYSVLAETTYTSERRDSWGDIYLVTEYESSDYACAVVHYEARGGDIGEEPWSYDPFNGPISVYLDDSAGKWRLTVDFNSVYFTGSSDAENRPETWTVKLLCVRTSVASMVHPPYLGDNVTYPLGFGFQTKICGIASFYARTGDINEKGVQDIMQMYLDRGSMGEWVLRADFATHTDHENWDVNFLCLDPSIATVDGPLPGKPFFLQEFRGPGGYSVGEGLTDYDTHISSTDHVCGVVGFSAMEGDIDEDDFRGNPQAGLLLAFMQDIGGTWHFRGDFRSQHPHEYWDHLNVLCALKDNNTLPAWSVSHFEQGPESCDGFGTSCQALHSEAGNPQGSVWLVGGGYSGTPNFYQTSCGGPEYVELIVNERDPNTGKPRWDSAFVTHCLRHGDYYYITPGDVVDLRGVSVGAYATPLSFELRGPSPDLKIEAIGWPTTASAGSLVNFDYLVSNTGFATTLPGYVNQLYIDGVKISNTQGQQGSRLGVELEHQESESNSLSWLATCGAHTVEARADDFDLMDEINEGDNVVSQALTVPCSPYVELSPPSPLKTYYSGDEQVTFSVADHYGVQRFSWHFNAYSGAGYRIVSNCESGPIQLGNAKTCTIQLTGASAFYETAPRGKLSALVPEKSVDVHLWGEDGNGNLLVSDSYTLHYERPQLPPAPTWKTPSHSGNTPSSITFTWNDVAGETSYALRHSDGRSIAPDIDADATSYQVTGLSPNANTSVQVRACNGADCSAWSVAASAYTSANTPNGLTGSPSCSGIRWTWSANGNLGNTQYYVQTNAYSSQWMTGTSWLQSGVTSGTITGQVQAKNGDGDLTSFSPTGNVAAQCVTPTPPPTTPPPTTPPPTTPPPTTPPAVFVELLSPPDPLKAK